MYKSEFLCYNDIKYRCIYALMGTILENYCGFPPDRIMSMEKEKRQYTKNSRNGGNYRNGSRDEFRRSSSEREDYSLSADVPVSGNVIIGRNAVRELLKSGASVDKLLVSGREGSIVALVAEARKAGIPVVNTDVRQLDKLSGGENHQGIVAFAAEKDYCSVEDILAIAEERGE